jgi:release factor glutamine methyltransferase
LKIKEFIKQYNNIEIELLLMEVLGKSKEFLYMNPKHRLTRIQINRLTRLIKRRETGEPVAYILGYKDFMGLRFKVNKHTLIPRPETELIVELVMQSIKELNKKSVKNKQINILDVGTGSGCIPISIVKLLPIIKYPNIQISASDISPTALTVAKQNAKNLIPQFSHTPMHGRIEFIKSDLLTKINANKELDIIVANLPYGWFGVKNRFSSVKDGLKFEPKLALYTKEKGLYEIHRLLQQISLRKNKPKFIFLEFDPRQKIELEKLAKQIFPKAKYKFYKDYRLLWRVCRIEIF